MRMKVRLLYAVTAFALLMIEAGAALGQGFILPGMGTRKNGTGVAVGRPDEITAIYHNPAALVNLKGSRMYFNANAALLNTHFRLMSWPKSDEFITTPVDSEGFYPEVKPKRIFAVVPFLGWSTKLWSEDLAAAVAIYIPNAAGASFHADSVARYHLLDSFIVAGMATLAVADRPVKWFSFGVGLSIAYVYLTATRKLYPVLKGLDLRDFLGKEPELTISGDDVLPVFNMGLLFWPHKKVSIGFMVFSRYNVEFEGDVKVKLDPPVLINDDVLTGKHKTKAKAPWIFSIGINWDITWWLEVGVEFRYYTNSLVTEQRTTTSGEINAYIPELVTPKNYNDNFQTGIGFVIKPWRHIKLEFMTGWHWQDSEAPDNTVDISAPAFDLWGLHFGVRYTFGNRLTLSFTWTHYQYLERHSRNSLTTPPANFDGSGSSNYISLVVDWRFATGIGMSKSGK